jgi:hypothetical protein
MLAHTMSATMLASARWCPQAKTHGHRRVRRAVRQALKGYPPREFALTVKEGARFRAL